jgi:hypothetical protein
MVDVVIEAEGDEAQQALADVAVFFTREFGATGVPQAPTPRAKQRGFDPAWLAIALSVPSAILGTLELAERLRLIERITAMLEGQRARLGKAVGVIRIGDTRPPFDIATVKAQEIIDALSEDGDKNGEGGLD